MYCFVSFIALDLNLTGKWAHFEDIIIHLLLVAWQRNPARPLAIIVRQQPKSVPRPVLCVLRDLLSIARL